eukprot:CAMPEP_0194285916 /NCGR_PEP_ID=MMETSP0169-20130528/31313_1 /TAXON_ID=218684 /ORGANISM="Corethron pennatum, Strain L29A3" /LENGTH=724 /DNA_ID=CAMNT_0039032165 /DNA_START=166 /DNA_END=2340 /DNA_ORIENTATION=+
MGLSKASDEQIKNIMEDLLDSEDVAKTRKKILLILIAVILFLSVSNIGTTYLAVTLATETKIDGDRALVNKHSGEAITTIGRGVTLDVDMSVIDERPGEKEFCLRIDDLAHLWHAAESGSQIGIISKIGDTREGIDLDLHGAVESPSGVCFPTSKDGRFCVNLEQDICSSESTRRLMNDGVNTAKIRKYMFEKYLEANHNGIPIEKLSINHLLENSFDTKNTRQLRKSRNDDDGDLDKFLASGTYITDPDVMDVAIIGAGWAGLAAGSYFLKKNRSLKFSIIEANSYIGGRSHTDYFKGGEIPVDIGSAWIQNYEDSYEEKIYEIFQDVKNKCAQDSNNIHKFGTTYINYEESSQIHYMFGKGELSREKRESLLQELWTGDNGYVNFGVRMRSKLRRGKDKNYDEVLQKYEYENQILPNTIEKEFLESMENSEITTAFGADPDKVFIKNTFYDDGAPMLHMGGSFGELADKFAKCRYASGTSINIAEKIILESYVTKIEYSSSHVTITYISEGETRTIKAKQVLITVPLGVLKHEDIIFSPALPKWKSSAVESLGFGVLDKWIGYWHDDVVLPWDVNSTVWLHLVEDAQFQGEIHFKAFFNEYVTNGNHKILTAFIGGKAAVEMEKKENQEIYDLVMLSLKEMFPNATVPAPNEFKVSRWGQNPNFRGSYSIPSKNQMYDSKRLKENIDGKLFFAGEATAGEWYGTASGAYMSGVDAAREILKR